jgi:hypothetical protein
VHGAERAGHVRRLESPQDVGRRFHQRQQRYVRYRQLGMRLRHT